MNPEMRGPSLEEMEAEEIPRPQVGEAADKAEDVRNREAYEAAIDRQRFTHNAGPAAVWKDPELVAHHVQEKVAHAAPDLYKDIAQIGQGLTDEHPEAAIEISKFRANFHFDETSDINRQGKVNQKIDQAVLGDLGIDLQEISRGKYELRRHILDPNLASRQNRYEIPINRDTLEALGIHLPGGVQAAYSLEMVSPGSTNITEKIIVRKS